jgi:hypothetical protein
MGDNHRRRPGFSANHAENRVDNRRNSLPVKEKLHWLIPALLLECLVYVLRRHREGLDADADRVAHGVDDGGVDARVHRLTHRLGAEGAGPDLRQYAH